LIFDSKEVIIIESIGDALACGTAVVETWWFLSV